VQCRDDRVVQRAGEIDPVDLRTDVTSDPNDEANFGYAAEGAARFELPVLFVHSTWDQICDTVHSRLAEPMRADCVHLSEVRIDAGHWLTLERPAEVSAALETWSATV
jgi:pimeloyl-ACP methyl ester carboxylesterase